MRIEYFFSILSPFTYLAGDRLERVAAARGVAIEYRPADLLKVFSEMGTPPVPKRHPARQAYRLQELRRLSRRAGLPLNVRPAHWPTDAAPGSAAIIAAQDAGADAGAVARALLRACWAEERDVAEPQVVAAALREGGADPALAAGTDAARAAYARNTAEMVERGAFGAPFYFVGDEMFWGQDRIEHLAEHLDEIAEKG